MGRFGIDLQTWMLILVGCLILWVVYRATRR